jgi:hypothetical protein
MLEKERLKQLEKIAGEGNKAQNLLNEYMGLTHEIEQLEHMKEVCGKCFNLTFNNGYALFKVTLRNKEFGALLIKNILQNEINAIQNQLDNLE